MSSYKLQCPFDFLITQSTKKIKRQKLKTHMKNAIHDHICDDGKPSE